MQDKTGVFGNVEISGNMDQSGSRRVGLDPEGIGMLMSILSNQYTDKDSAVLREYFCNGWDSHVESGRTNTPVLVTLPSTLQPSLLIQDYGRGLAEDEMISIFGTYGKSTKRDTAAQTGAFGIGSKSAWTMGQQFIVTGVKDGVKTVALFGLDEENVGTCDIIRTQTTDEPNGVLIALSVPDVDSMNEAAERFFTTVDSGTALVNGEIPTTVWETATKINDQTYIVPEGGGQIFVVMAQVAYVVDPSILRKVTKALKDTDAAPQAAALESWAATDTTVYFRVPNRTVTPHPSRERLRDTALTINTLSGLVTDLAKDMSATVQAAVDAAPSLYAAQRALRVARESLGAFKVARKSITYLGLPIKATATVDLPHFWTTTKSWKHSTLIVASEMEKGKTLDSEQAERALVVTGVPKGEESKVSRYLKRFLADAEEAEGVEWVFVSDQPWGAFDWFAFGTENGARTMTLEEYKASLRKAAASNPRTKSEPSYTTGWSVRADRDLEGRDLLTDIIDQGLPIVYFHDSNFHLSQVQREALEGKYTPVVLLGQQSADALVKRVVKDGSVEIYHYRNSEVTAVVQAYAEAEFVVTDEEREALDASKWLSANYSKVDAWDDFARNLYVDPLEITSPAFWDAAETIELVRMVAGALTAKRRERLEALADHLGKEITAKPLEVDLRSPKKVYPLVGFIAEHVGSFYLKRANTVQAEILEYINAR
jgi:hypothetical protein